MKRFVILSFVFLTACGTVQKTAPNKTTVIVRKEEFSEEDLNNFIDRFLAENAGKDIKSEDLTDRFVEEKFGESRHYHSVRDLRDDMIELYELSLEEEKEK